MNPSGMPYEVAGKLYRDIVPEGIRKKIFKIRFRHFRPFELRKDRIGGFPEAIKLALSVACQANCIFCPASRGKSISPKHMPSELVRKIVDEAKTTGFGGEIYLSENGEALLNPQFLDILDYIAGALPEAGLLLFTNMDRLDAQMAAEILGRGLAELHFNIDGATKETYEFVKKNLSFEAMERNVRDLLSVRAKFNSPCRLVVGIVTAHKYLKLSRGGRVPFKDDAKDIIEKWRPLLRPTDKIYETDIYRWEIRDKIRKPKKGPCPMFHKLLEDCYVAPNGAVYICCYDENARIILGDAHDQSIEAIWNGEERFRIMRLLALQRFDLLGPPCSICLEELQL